MVKTSFILVFLLVFGCIQYQTITKQKLYNNNFNTNGYYIGEQNGIYNILFFYRDGVVRYIGSKKTDNNLEISNYIFKEYINSKPKINSRTGWGTFIIDGKKIEYDMYAPRADAPIYTRRGEILNDSTFVIKSISEFDGKKTNPQNTIYHFRKFNPKPDSTNSFIK